jgi:putative ribosome biogenesis GTPase RsgA
LRLQIHDANNDDVNKIVAQIKQKYKPTELTINRINSTYIVGTKNKNVEIHNLQSVEYQNELIEKYLIEYHNLDKEVIDIICKINTETNKEIKIDDTIKNVKWKPVYFKWSNMFSYGENNIVNFNNLKDVVGLFGPNATGKSAFVDSLSFCYLLFFN